MSYNRAGRVGDLIKKEIAEMVVHGGIKDHRVGFVTITHVKMTPDLKEATVYFSQIGTDEEKKKSAAGLNSASGYIRRVLAKTLKLKHIPTIRFFFDDTLEYADHIEKIIKEMKKEGGL